MFAFTIDLFLCLKKTEPKKLTVQSMLKHVQNYIITYMIYVTTSKFSQTLDVLSSWVVTAFLGVGGGTCDIFG